MRGSQRADALATTCGARMRDGSRAPCLLRLCAPRFAHRTCTLYVLSSSSSASAARHRTLEDSRDRHDLNQPEIHRVPRIREFYPRQPFLTNTIKKRKERNKERKKERSIVDRRPRIPVSISFEKNKIRKKPKRNVSTRLKDDSKESDKREKRRKRSRKIRANAKERRNEETNEQQQQQQQQLGD